MQVVYLVFESAMGEGNLLKGVFSTFEKAEAFQAKIMNQDKYHEYSYYITEEYVDEQE